MTCVLSHFHFSPVQGEQTGAHHPVEPPRAPHWRKRGVHRLHSTDAVHGRWRHAPHHAVRGDPRVAPPRGQVAEHPLPPLRLTQYSLPVRDSTDTGHGPKGHTAVFTAVDVTGSTNTRPRVQHALLPRKTTAHPSLDAVRQGCTNVLLLDRFDIPGGSYPQCCAPVHLKMTTACLPARL